MPGKTVLVCALMQLTCATPPTGTVPQRYDPGSCTSESCGVKSDSLLQQGNAKVLQAVRASSTGLVEDVDALSQAAARAMASLHPSRYGKSNEKGQVFFMHIPKNAGTYVETNLRESLPANMIVNLPGLKADIFCSPYHQPLSELFRLAQQTLLTAETTEMLLTLFDQLTMVTEAFAVLRHPYARAYSQWEWLHPKGYSDKDLFVQDAIRNASGTDRRNDRSIDLELRVSDIRGGPFHQDCHWVSQASYVLSPDRTQQIVHRLIWIGSITTELAAILERRNVTVPHEKFKPSEPPKLQPTHACEKVLVPLSNETLDMLDEWYADDFNIFGFRKLRGEELCHEDLYVPIKVVEEQVLLAD